MQGPVHSIRNQEKLIGDLRHVIENAEQLLKNTDQNIGSLYQQARARLALALQAAIEELAQFEDAQLLRMIDATHGANLRCDDRTGEAKLLRAFD